MNDRAEYVTKPTPIRVEVEGISQPLEFPEGTDPSVIERTVKNLIQSRANIEQDAIRGPGGQYKIGEIGAPVMGNLEATARGVASYVEPIMQMGSAALSEPVSGVVGAIATPVVGAEGGSSIIDATSRSLTYQPRLEESRQNMQSLGEFARPIVTPVAEGIQAVSDFAADSSGSNLIGTAVSLGPAALLEYIGLKGVGRLRGTRMLTPDGKPTKELTVVLNKKGLNYADLTPDAKRAIPEFAEVNLLQGGGKRQLGIDAQKNQLSTGGRDNALAPYEMVNGKVKTNAMYQNAIGKGWREGTVQMVKTANRQTKDVMRKMLEDRWRLLQSDSNAGKLFPLNAVGDSFFDRIKFIGDKAKQARIDLDRIAKTKLRGVRMNAQAIEGRFYQMLGDLDASYTVNPQTGVPRINYKGSIIQADKTSQRMINEALKLMSTPGPVDAYRFHIMKRQLDSLIDFQKKSKTGITEEGRRFLKGLRHELNKELRSNFDDYAEVNDVLSASLDAMDEFKRASGVDIHFLDDPAAAIGQELRKLHTNYKKRTLIEQSANRVDELARNLGGTFNTNYTDLAQFANRMDEVFGASKSGSFQGLSEVGMAYATEGGPAAVRATGRTIRDTYKKFKNSDLFPAYQAMDELLK